MSGGIIEVTRPRVCGNGNVVVVEVGVVLEDLAEAALPVAGVIDEGGAGEDDAARVRVGTVALMLITVCRFGVDNDLTNLPCSLPEEEVGAGAAEGVDLN
jgi:hypothetical protein